MTQHLVPELAESTQKRSISFHQEAGDNIRKRSFNINLNPEMQQQQQQQYYGSGSNLKRRTIADPNNEATFVIGQTILLQKYSFIEKILIFLSYCLIVLFFPFSLCLVMKVTQEFERAVIFRLGRLIRNGVKGPGLIFFLPCIDTYNIVDMRTVSFDIPPQEILTKDSVTIAVDAVVYYRVFNPVMSISNVENAAESTRLIAQTSLRNVLGTCDLSEILSNREEVSQLLREILKEATYEWGIRAERVEIKDVRLPVQLQRAMAAEAEATREAKAKVIAAEGEHKASYSLKKAAVVLSECGLAYQLRYLQTLTSIATENNSTILFPVPIDFQSILSK